MLSILPTASEFDSMLDNPFPAFDGASMPWEYHDHDHEFMSAVFQLSEPAELDVVFHSSNPVISSSSSENRDEPDDKVEAIDERKRRRKESNRESARRSRMRKQKQEENLKNMVNKLRVENQAMSNELRFTLNHVNRIRSENDRLETEHTILGQKLLYIRQALIIRQFQRQIPYNSYEQQQQQQQIRAPNLSQLQYNLKNNNNNNLINC